MRQGHAPRRQAQTSVTVKVDPRVLLASQLLQLGHLELRQALESELQENPALERLDEDDEPLTDAEIVERLVPEESKQRAEDFEYLRSIPQQPSDDIDWTDFAPSIDSLHDRLRAQLLPQLPPEQQSLGEYLIGCVDARGYFDGTVEEAALATDVELEAAERALSMLQRCEPPGVAATTLQECLLLQLRGQTGTEAKVARAILRHCFESFRDRDVRAICRRLRLMPEVVESAIALLLDLTPYPAETIEEHRSHVGPIAVPDVVLTRSESGWDVFVPGPTATSVAVHRAYRERLKQVRSAPTKERAERRHLTEYVERAERFIQALDQRHGTMRAIGEYLLDHQSGFVSTGRYEFLKSLTRTQVARDLGLHESTISRATMGKCVQIATGEVVPFEVFFKPALRVQKMIEEILASENPNSPLSDERIAAMLAERGVAVARRTVNKYRDRTKLLSSRRRRSA